MAYTVFCRHGMNSVVPENFNCLLSALTFFFLLDYVGPYYALPPRPPSTFITLTSWTFDTEATVDASFPHET